MKTVVVEEDVVQNRGIQVWDNGFIVRADISHDGFGS